MKDILLFIIISICLTSCEKDKDKEANTCSTAPFNRIEEPEEMNIDINNDGQPEFNTSTATAIADGPNYVAYYYSLDILSINRETTALLRSINNLGPFLSVGDTIVTTDTDETSWGSFGISYAAKLLECTNNYAEPAQWDISSTNNDPNVIVAYRILNASNEAYLGYIKFVINPLDGSIEITKISEPALTDQLVVR